MGGQRFPTAAAEVFEPADPARTMPKWLVLGAIAAVILLVALMSWLNRRSLEQPGDAAANAAVAGGACRAAGAGGRRGRATAQGPVVLTATAPAWIQVTDQGKTLFEGDAPARPDLPVPSTAVAPMLEAGAPEALRINVGTAVAPQVGPAGQVTSNVSLQAGRSDARPRRSRAAAPAAPRRAAPPASRRPIIAP